MYINTTSTATCLILNAAILFFFPHEWMCGNFFHPWVPRSYCTLSKEQTFSQALRTKVVYAVSALHVNQNLILTPLVLMLLLVSNSLLSCVGHFLLRYSWLCISKFESHFLFLFFSNLFSPVTLCLSLHWCFLTSFGLELSLN